MGTTEVQAIIAIVLTIVGSFISLLLIVNAWFTRQTWMAVNELKVQVAVNDKKHDAVDERSRKNELEIEELKKKINQ